MEAKEFDKFLLKLHKGFLHQLTGQSLSESQIGLIAINLFKVEAPNLTSIEYFIYTVLPRYKKEELFTRRELEIASCTDLLNQEGFTMDKLAEQLETANQKIEGLIKLIKNLRDEQNGIPFN